MAKKEQNTQARTGAGANDGFEIREDSNNYRKHTDINKKTIRASLKDNGAGRSIVVDNTGMVIGGNGVLEQAEKLGIKKKLVETNGDELVVVVRKDISPDDPRRKKLALADNASGLLSEWDFERLRRDFSAIDLAKLEIKLPPMRLEEDATLGGTGDGEEQDVPEGLQDLHLDERMQKAKYVFFSFSGGRDSTRAIYLTAKKFLESGKRCEAVYVESPCEFPDLVQHIRRVCRDVGLPLHCIHPEVNYLTEYAEKGESPDAIFMDCVEKLVSHPLDVYTKSVCGDEDYILVRGGQGKQKTARSKTAGMHQPKSKPNLLIYNPLFYATKEQLEMKIPEWQGYSKGFLRTACWCCPFQKAEQYEALKRNYPLLYEELKEIVRNMKFRWHKGDFATKKKFLYWEEKEGIQIQWTD